MSSVIRKQRKLKKEKRNKKWSIDEIKCILNYLENSTDVEVPTAQIYYRKLISETGINATWDLIRWKVRYLKTTYKKARDWRNSPEARSMELDEGTESVEAKLLQICPQFHQLNNIFGDMRKSQILWHEIIDTGEPVETASIKVDADESCEASEIAKVDLNIFDESSVANNCTSSQNCDFRSNKEISSDKIQKHPTRNFLTNNIRTKPKEFPDGIKKSNPQSLISCLIDFQSEKTSMFKMKFEWERKKHKDEMEILRKKMVLDEEKAKAEIELRKKELELRAREMERDERLKVLEMEKDERIKKYEIEMRLKHQNNQC